MQLIFFDRRAQVAQPVGEAFLTIEKKGVFSLSIAAGTALGLKAGAGVVLVQDAQTNTWYLLLNALPGQEPFKLKPRDTNGKGLIFCGSQSAHKYYQAHGLGEQKSVRSAVSATAIEHDGMKLYPLVPQHSTKTPAVVEPAAPVADAPVVAAPEVEQPVPADVMPAVAPSFLEPEQSGTPPMLTTSAVPRLAPGALPESRGEQLADYWNEREVSEAKPEELEEILKVIGGMARSDRGFTENKVLNQAKTEAAKRLKAANKKHAKA